VSRLEIGDRMPELQVGSVLLLDSTSRGAGEGLEIKPYCVNLSAPAGLKVSLRLRASQLTSSMEEACMKITMKANGKRLKPWKAAETIFHVEETVRAEHLELVQKAHLVPQSERKKHDSKDIFEPGEVFFMIMEMDKGPTKVAHVHWRPVVDCGEHYRFLNPDGTLGERVVSAIVVRRQFQQ
jgi:hypothetical protein